MITLDPVHEVVGVMVQSLWFQPQYQVVLRGFADITDPQERESMEVCWVA